MVAPNNTNLTVPVLAELSDEDQQPSPSLAINRLSSKATNKNSGAYDPDDAAPTTPPTGTQSLEQRVAELESKLATLSHLLARRQSSDNDNHHNAPSPPEPAHFLNELMPDSPSLRTSSQSVPPLESPHPTGGDLIRRLSLVILRDDNDDSNPTLVFPELHKQSNATITDHQRADDNKKTAPTMDEDESQQQQPNLDNSKPSVRQKWMDYLESFQESTPNVDEQMQEFVRVPSQLESLLTFGLSICVDSYLYILTMLPIKFLWSILLLLRSLVAKKDKYKYHRRHFYNMIQVFIIYIVYRFILVPISIGQLYHWIRGQAMLKLYVLIAIVEVFDRLMCSMGQDCLDSMYWNTTRRPRSWRMLVSVTVVMVYAACHTLILFVHVATLNVAINSADHALLTVLISGNFAEIKSTVFKKYNKPTLFKISAGDICERFKLALFLSLVLMLNMCQGMDSKMTFDYLTMCALVYSAELLADWMKHSFITKFNFIPSKVYAEYSLLLAGDVTGIGHEGVNLDHSHAVVKRLGFAQIPLVCVMLRLVTEAFRYYSAQHEGKHQTLMLTAFGVAVWGVLCGIKLLLGSYLQRICHQKLEAAPELIKTPKKKKKKE
mmetsp:Transcript_8505/g.14096  ORF Transcript_8505/g.14096 Transcript_8505/m.14096 type:complete len:606 (-) Transcript_8505:69-1886(-)